jgi:hypothetical protein
MKICTVIFIALFVSACYKCPGESGYSPQCGRTAQGVR